MLWSKKKLTSWPKWVFCFFKAFLLESRNYFMRVTWPTYSFLIASRFSFAFARRADRSVGISVSVFLPFIDPSQPFRSVSSFLTSGAPRVSPFDVRYSRIILMRVSRSVGVSLPIAILRLCIGSSISVPVPIIVPVPSFIMRTWGPPPGHPHTIRLLSSHPLFCTAGRRSLSFVEPVPIGGHIFSSFPVGDCVRVDFLISRHRALASLVNVSQLILWIYTSSVSL